MGIYEIKQQNNALLLFQKKINMQQIASLTSSMKGRVMVNAGAKPYISVKIDGNTPPLDLLREVLKNAQGTSSSQEG